MALCWAAAGREERPARDCRLVSTHCIANIVGSCSEEQKTFIKQVSHGGSFPLGLSPSPSLALVVALLRCRLRLSLRVPALIFGLHSDHRTLAARFAIFLPRLDSDCREQLCEEKTDAAT